MPSRALIAVRQGPSTTSCSGVRSDLQRHFIAIRIALHHHASLRRCRLLQSSLETVTPRHHAKVLDGETVPLWVFPSDQRPCNTGIQLLQLHRVFPTPEIAFLALNPSDRPTQKDIQAFKRRPEKTDFNKWPGAILHASARVEAPTDWTQEKSLHKKNVGKEFLRRARVSACFIRHVQLSWKF